MSFRYDIVDLNALAAHPKVLDEREDLREILDKSAAMKEFILDRFVSGQVNGVIVNGVEFRLVRQ